MQVSDEMDMEGQEEKGILDFSSLGQTIVVVTLSAGKFLKTASGRVEDRKKAMSSAVNMKSRRMPQGGTSGRGSGA